MSSLKWVTPFIKQCFVTSGVSINMMGGGIVLGYSTIILPQLKEKNSTIAIDDSMGSWIVAVVSFALLAGNILMPGIMSKFGRKKANIICVMPLLTGWLIIAFAKNFASLLVARFIQGITLGMNTVLGSVLVGEYTSPKYRGALLSTISLAISCGNLFVQGTGFILGWQITALTCAFICILNLLIILKSPESPSWLANQGRYDDCRKAFNWLRGDDENAELEALIQAARVAKATNDRDQALTMIKAMKSTFRNYKLVIKKKEFYKPVIMVIHLYTLSQWGGSNLLASYSVDVYQRVIGSESNIPFLIFTVNVQRIISNLLAIYLVKRIRRRSLLVITCLINIAVYLATAVYVYAKTHNFIEGSAGIGITLIHIHMFSIATGTLILPYVIAGEVFPLQYRGQASAVSTLLLCPNMFVVSKTLPYLFENIGLHGTYCVYAGMVAYCFAVAIAMLPETKDRTLQEIEEEFRGRRLTDAEVEEVKSVMSKEDTEQTKDHSNDLPDS